MNSKNKIKILIGDLKKSVLLLPALIVLMIFFVTPILLTIYYSFTNLALSGSGVLNFKFVNFENYIRVFKDPAAIVSIKNTIIFLVGCLIGQSVLGFILAYFMREKAAWFRRIVGTIVLAGWIMPEIVVAMCCSNFFSDGGTLNSILEIFHIEPIEWLYRFPMLTVILANVWHGTAFSMMNFQSALDSVCLLYTSMGMPVCDIIDRVTRQPAKVIGHTELGSLKEGECADIAVLNIVEGPYNFSDSGNAKLCGNKRFENMMTIRNGKIVYNPYALGLEVWEKAPKEYWEAPGVIRF